VNVHEVYSVFEFEETSNLPIYSFVVCAGNYEESNYLDADEVDIKIYKRPEIQFVEDDRLIVSTIRHALKWVKNNLTDINPFPKIELAFVPGLTNKAMENVGCITFDEKYIHQLNSPMHKTYFHYLIIHEM
jgi:aminopeptidase N